MQMTTAQAAVTPAGDGLALDFSSPSPPADAAGDGADDDELASVLQQVTELSRTISQDPGSPRNKTLLAARTELTALSQDLSNTLPPELSAQLDMSPLLKMRSAAHKIMALQAFKMPLKIQPAGDSTADRLTEAALGDDGLDDDDDLESLSDDGLGDDDDDDDDEDDDEDDDLDSLPDLVLEPEPEPEPEVELELELKMELQPIPEPEPEPELQPEPELEPTQNALSSLQLFLARHGGHKLGSVGGSEQAAALLRDEFAAANIAEVDWLAELVAIEADGQLPALLSTLELAGGRSRSEDPTDDDSERSSTAGAFGASLREPPPLPETASARAVARSPPPPLQQPPLQQPQPSKRSHQKRSRKPKQQQLQRPQQQQQQQQQRRRRGARQSQQRPQQRPQQQPQPPQQQQQEALLQLLLQQQDALQQLQQPLSPTAAAPATPKAFIFADTDHSVTAAFTASFAAAAATPARAPSPTASPPEVGSPQLALAMAAGAETEGHASAAVAQHMDQLIKAVAEMKHEQRVVCELGLSPHFDTKT